MIKQKISRVISTLLILAILSGGVVAAEAATSKKTVTNSIVSKQIVANTASTSASSINPDWGLGENQTEYISNNRPYYWYIDQAHTGMYANNNCGPASTIMSLKWQNSNFYKNVEDARQTYPENGGWWYAKDVANYLELNDGKYSLLQSTGEELLKTKLKQGNILILCIDTTYIPYNNNSNQRVGRFYDYKGGHFIVIKGYRVVDGNTYFEAYDPNNWDARYSDGQEKGLDRYYLSQDVMNAMSNWWNYLFVIQNQDTVLSSKAAIIEKQIQKDIEVDINKIKSARGR